LGGRGAPNVDGEAPRVASGWFLHVEDGTLTPAVGSGPAAERSVE
jgi:hypothetical protein